MVSKQQAGQACVCMYSPGTNMARCSASTALCLLLLWVLFLQALRFRRVWTFQAWQYFSTCAVGAEVD